MATRLEDAAALARPRRLREDATDVLRLRLDAPAELPERVRVELAVERCFACTDAIAPGCTRSDIKHTSQNQIEIGRILK